MQAQQAKGLNAEGLSRKQRSRGHGRIALKLSAFTLSRSKTIIITSPAPIPIGAGVADGDVRKMPLASRGVANLQPSCTAIGTSPCSHGNLVRINHRPGLPQDRTQAVYQAGVA